MIQTNHFSQIIVIESLPGGEIKTGSILHGQIDAQIRENNLPISTALKECESKRDFLSILEAIHLEAVSNNEYPWIHIECHGTSTGDGIVLSNGDFVQWRELKSELIKINLACKCNLMIAMAACNGAYLAEVLQPTDRAPCWGLLGPANELHPDDLMASFRTFYTNLLSSFSGDIALKAFHKIIEERKLEFLFATAQDFFKKAYSGYLSEYCTDKAYWKRAMDIKKQAPSTERYKYSLQDLVLILKKQEPGSFQNYKDKFFMSDLFPENAARFPITYNDVSTKA